jgi:cell division protein FtsA
MPKRTDRNLIVGLDIGTSKVVALVGELKADGELEVIGIGSHPSRGLKRGVVVNIDSTVQSIQRAVEQAELMAGVEINAVYTGIAGSHVRSLNSHGIVAIKDKEVTQGDVARVMDAAQAVALPADQRILHVIPQEFIIDSQEGIRDPIGMSGVRLEARVHIVTGAETAAQNIMKCVQRCGLRSKTRAAAAHGRVRCSRTMSGSRRLPGRHRRRHDRHRSPRACVLRLIRSPATGHQRHRRDAHPDAYAEEIRSATRALEAPARHPTRRSGAQRRRPSAARLARADLADRESRAEELRADPAAAPRAGFERESYAAGISSSPNSAKMEGASEARRGSIHVPVRLGIAAGRRRPRRRRPQPDPATGSVSYGYDAQSQPGGDSKPLFPASAMCWSG